MIRTSHFDKQEKPKSFEGNKAFQSGRLRFKTSPKSASISLLLNPGKKNCSVSECTSLSKSRGLCKRHGGGSRCKMIGCTTSAKTGGYCIKHGGGRCCVDGCKTGARTASLCTFHHKQLVETLCNLHEIFFPLKTQLFVPDYAP